VHVRDLELQRLDDLYLIAYAPNHRRLRPRRIDRCLRSHGAPIKAPRARRLPEQGRTFRRPRDQPPLPSTWESRMSDEVPFTAINSRFPSRSSRRNPDARDTRLLRRVGGRASRPASHRVLLKQFLDTKQPPVRMALLPEMAVRAKRTPSLVDCIRILQAWGAYDRIEPQQKTSPSCSSGRIGSTSSASIIRRRSRVPNTPISGWKKRRTSTLKTSDSSGLRLGRNKANENARYIFTFNPIDAQH